MRFGENINNVVNALRGGMNQFRGNLGSFFSNPGNRRQAPTSAIDVLGGFVQQKDPRDRPPGGPIAQVQVPSSEQTKPLQPTTTRPEDLARAGVDPAQWQGGMPVSVDVNGTSYYAYNPSTQSWGNPLEAATFPTYSRDKYGIPMSSLQNWYDTALASNLGPLQTWKLNQLWNRIMHGASAGVDANGKVVYIQPSDLGAMRDLSGSIGYDFGPLQEEWLKPGGYSYGEPTDPQEGWTLLSSQDPWDVWSNMPGFNENTAKWLASTGVLPGADSSSPWSPTGGYDAGVGNMDLNTLLEWVGMGMRTTPLGSEMSPEFLSSLLSSLNQGQTMWTGGGDTEDYLQNIQPMVSLPMGY